MHTLLHQQLIKKGEIYWFVSFITTVTTSLQNHEEVNRIGGETSGMQGRGAVQRDKRVTGLSGERGNDSTISKKNDGTK